MENKQMLFSILIAARNEAKVINTLLNSLNSLDFPTELYEILFANDNSEDETGEILDDYARESRNTRVLHLEERKNNEVLYGKARALAEIANIAKGKYLLFTDADMEVPESWLKGYLSEIQEGEYGIIVGVSSMRPTNIKAALQGTEWLNALLSVQFLYEKGYSTTGLGNNMLVLKAAYKKIGGYEKLGFSIIEDYQLYAAIINASYNFKHVFIKKVLTFTLPPQNYFEQRSRWISGVLADSKPSIKVGLMFVSLLIPIYIILSVVQPILGIALFTVNSTIHVVSTLISTKKLQLNGYRRYLPIYIFYSPIIWFSQLCYYVFGPKVKWKNRVFE